MSLEQLDRAAAATVCDALSAGGTALVGTGVATAAIGGGGLVPFTLGMASLLAANYACGPTDIQENPNTPPSGTSGCIETSGASFPRYSSPGGLTGGAGFDGIQWDKIISVVPESSGDPDYTYYTVTCRRIDGGVVQADRQLRATGTTFYLDPGPGASCIRNSDDLPPPPDPYTQPRPYTDPVTNCSFIVTPQGFFSKGQDQPVQPVLKIETAPALRAGGGIVGGCNFEPVIYVGGGGGTGQPPTTGPWNPDWPDQPGGGTPPWLDFVNDLVAGLASQAIADGIRKLTETKYPEGTKTIYAACEYKEDGSKEEFTVNFPEETYQERVLTALNAITDFQQQILYWKTPICSGAPQPLTGDPVSINWVSDEYSPNGNNRIRKLLTYFDQKNTSLADTVAHWKDFTWDAGPVIVSCVGTPLGKPQVWAVSVDEAKRVINHAAAIAGVDTTNAQWLVAPPKSARFGMQGKMRVHRGANGALGITKRDGPNGLPPALT